LFYEQTIGNSDRFDIRMDVYFNQYRYQKILEFNSIGISTRPYPEEIEYNYTMNYVTLSIMPVFQVVENLKIGLGLEYSLWTNSSVEEITTYYIIDSLTNNKQQTHKRVFIRKSTKGEFLDRSYYGAKLSATYQIGNRFDLGISYRYMGKFKLGPYIDPFFFNAITLTTHFYIKTK
jgi:long-subunit fatty acid transport protein